MNVLLINPLCRLPYMLPLGLGYIASFLRREGYKVKILDINGFGYSRAKVEELIKGIEYDVVGIGGLSSTYKYVKWLADTIKKHKPHVNIVAGNLVATAHPELLLQKSRVDIAVIDEGELTFAELLSAIKERRDLKGVKGIFYKHDGNVVKTGPRDRITDLDSLPFPAWDLFPMETYLNNSTLSAASFGLRTVNVSSVRGCPYECTFCSHPFGRKIYSRSARSVVEEIKELKKRYRARFINSSDDLFLIDERFVLEFCERLISEKLDIMWSIPGRVNLVNDKMLKKMRKAGCAEIGYGFESGNQAVLDRMKKRVTVEQAEDAIKMTRKAKIKVAGSFIFGMPGETLETIEETLGFIKRARVPVHRFFYATPYPKTELYEIAKKMGRLPADEDKYLESLGEMRSTFLVNLTAFPNGELVRLKNLTEGRAKRVLGLFFLIEEFLEDWRRRYYVARQSVKKSGIGKTIKTYCVKAARKFIRKSPIKQKDG